MTTTEIVAFTIINTVMWTLIVTQTWNVFIKPASIKREWLGKDVRVVDLDSIYYDQVGKVELVLPNIGIVWVRFETIKGNFYNIKPFYFSKSNGFSTEQLRILHYETK